MPKTRQDTDARAILQFSTPLQDPVSVPGNPDPDFGQSLEAASRRFRRISARSTCS